MGVTGRRWISGAQERRLVLGEAEGVGGLPQALEGEERQRPWRMTRWGPRAAGRRAVLERRGRRPVGKGF